MLTRRYFHGRETECDVTVFHCQSTQVTSAEATVWRHRDPCDAILSDWHHFLHDWHVRTCQKHTALSSSSSRFCSWSRLFKVVRNDWQPSQRLTSDSADWQAKMTSQTLWRKHLSSLIDSVVMFAKGSRNKCFRLAVLIYGARLIPPPPRQGGGGLKFVAKRFVCLLLFVWQKVITTQIGVENVI